MTGIAVGSFEDMLDLSDEESTVHPDKGLCRASPDVRLNKSTLKLDLVPVYTSASSSGEASTGSNSSHASGIGNRRQFRNKSTYYLDPPNSKFANGKGSPNGSRWSFSLSKDSHNGLNNIRTGRNHKGSRFKTGSTDCVINAGGYRYSPSAFATLTKRSSVVVPTDRTRDNKTAKSIFGDFSSLKMRSRGHKAASFRDFTWGSSRQRVPNAGSAKFVDNAVDAKPSTVYSDRWKHAESPIMALRSGANERSDSLTTWERFQHRKTKWTSCGSTMQLDEDSISLMGVRGPLCPETQSVLGGPPSARRGRKYQDKDAMSVCSAMDFGSWGYAGADECHRYLSGLRPTMDNPNTHSNPNQTQCHTKLPGAQISNQRYASSAVCASMVELAPDAPNSEVTTSCNVPTHYSTLDRRVSNQIIPEGSERHCGDPVWQMSTNNITEEYDCVVPSNQHAYNRLPQTDPPMAAKVQQNGYSRCPGTNFRTNNDYAPINASPASSQERRFSSILENALPKSLFDRLSGLSIHNTIDK